MTEIEVVGKVVWKKFEPVRYKDKKTGEDKETMKGSIVVEHEREWFDKQGEPKKAKGNVAFDFFGTSAEHASKTEIGEEVQVKGNASANYWEKGDKWFSTVKAFHFSTAKESNDEVPF